MRHQPTLWISVLLAVVALLAVGVVNGQTDGEMTVESPQSGDASVTAEDAEAEQSARDVMEQLLDQRRDAPVVEPTRDPEVTHQPSRIGAPAATVDLDPAIVGIAPTPPGSSGGAGEQPRLLPEGTFIVNRRGRLIRSSDGAHVMFVFEADQADAPENPMILQPCRKLEDMEEYIEKHGDQTTFRLSGQVHTYRGANYLLPTMMIIDIDRGNLDS